MLRLDSFRYLVPDDVLAGIYKRARGLHDKHVVHINSTYSGGGVAVLLGSLVPLMNDVGVKTGWRILHGEEEFFGVTKEFHNALQGGQINLTDASKALYLDVNANFATFTHLEHDCVIVHDPQPLPLILHYRKLQPWIWRCHIDLTEPNAALWEFVKGILLKYDQVIVSNEKYMKKDLPVEQRIIFPAINPLSVKNQDLDDATALQIIQKAGILTDKPLITQVSRLDPWKDPEGVLDVFAAVKEQVDCRLVFCYNMASDDPEGALMHNKVVTKAKPLVDRGDVFFAGGTNELLVNALQRKSAVVIQKSIREGFCLAVTEAMWKETPVVASNVGGIPVQIQDGKNGYLLEPRDNAGFAERIVHLLKNPKEGQQIGKKARETVAKRFLTPRLLSDYLDLLNDVFAKK